jgi:hypothetical protein
VNRWGYHVSAVVAGNEDTKGAITGVPLPLPGGCKQWGQKPLGRRPENISRQSVGFASSFSLAPSQSVFPGGNQWRRRSSYCKTPAQSGQVHLAQSTPLYLSALRLLTFTHALRSEPPRITRLVEFPSSERPGRRPPVSCTARWWMV